MQKFLLAFLLLFFGYAYASAMSLEEYLGEPEKEFRRNKEEGNLLPYATGSVMYGYRIPGIEKEDLDKFFPNWNKNFINRFGDDPSPFFLDADFTLEEYWEAVEKFLVDYNKLLLEHIKSRHNQSLEVTPLADARGAPQL
ncbi:MAG: hypothetical protein AB3N10_16705 [Allomuricauda sp.]